MRIWFKTIDIITNTKTEIIDLTETVKKVVKESNIKNGIVNVFTKHTTTGLCINEHEEGLLKDIVNYLQEIVPEDREYYHHHFFYKDGRAAVNAWAHLRSILLGAFVTIPLSNGEIMLGSRQRIFFIELDGPLSRQLIIQVIGD